MTHTSQARDHSQVSSEKKTFTAGFYLARIPLYLRSEPSHKDNKASSLFLFSDPTNTQHLSHQSLSIPPLAPTEIVRYWSML